MLLRVTHETVYDYVPPVKNAQHMAHLKPLNGAHQQLLQHSLTISPQPAQQTEAVDLYGNTRAFFNLPAAHDALHVVAHSLVQTQPAEPPPASLPWEQVRERMRYQRGAAYDAATEFTFPSPYVPRHDDFVAYARPSFAADRPLLEAARRHVPEVVFAHMSTNKVYGDRPNTIRLKELATRWDYDDPAYTNGITEEFSIDQSKHASLVLPRSRGT